MKIQRGFGAIAAIVVLVILAGLAAAVVSLSAGQHLASAQDVRSAKAWQAARAGNEFGLYLALKAQDWNGANTKCDTTGTPRTATLDLRGDSGFYVTVTCTPYNYNEGETSPGTAKVVRIYRITAVACPSTTCPDTSATAAGMAYVERTRSVIATN